MAVTLNTDQVVTINGVDLSDHIQGVTLSLSAPSVNYMTIDSPAEKRVGPGGAVSGTVTLQFVNDFAASKVYATVWPLMGSVTAFTAKNTTDATGATNPEFQCSVSVEEFSPLDGSAGELNSTSVTWPVSGVVTAAVA